MRKYNAEEIFKFSPGIFQIEEYYRLSAVLNTYLDMEATVVVVMSRLDDFDENVIAKVNLKEKDHDVLGQGVLLLQGQQVIFDGLWILLSFTEPECIFNFSGDFTLLLARLDQTYKAPFEKYCVDKQTQGCLSHIFAKKNVAEFDLGNTEFIAKCRPVIVNNSGIISVYQ